MANERKQMVIIATLPDSYAIGKIGKYAQQYTDIASICDEEGADFRFLSPHVRNQVYGHSTAGRVLSDYFPKHMLYVDGPAENFFRKALVYPRDVFQVFGDKVFAYSFNRDIAKQIMEQTGRGNMEIIDSPIGEGGFLLRAKKIVIGPRYPSGNIDLFWNGVRDEGYDLFEIDLPLELCEKEGKLERRLGNKMFNGHIDTHMNVVFTKQDNLLLLANSDFNSVFCNQVDDLVKRLNAKKFVISNPHDVGYRAVNFLTLPSGKVVVNGACRETSDFLIRNLGDDNVWEIEVPHHKRTREGPLRCMTNVID